MPARRKLPLTCCLAASLCFGGWASADDPPQRVAELLAARCLDCHQGAEAAAGLDLTATPQDLDAPGALDLWVRIWDRVQAGEMPPQDAEPLTAAESSDFLADAKHWLLQDQRERYAALGRVRGRRLTNLQLERSLQALLGVDIPLANQLPEETSIAGFTTIAEGQSISHFQLERFLAVVDQALEDAFTRAAEPEATWKRRFAAAELCRKRPISRTREPELIDGAAVTWSSRLVFYGRLPATTVRESGWYRVTVQASAVKSPVDHGVWCTVRTGRCVSSAPLFSWVGAFEATEKPRQWTFETWIPRGHMLEIRPGDMTLKAARFRGGQVGTGEGDPQNAPGVAIDWLAMERVRQGPDNAAVRSLLLGDLTREQCDQLNPEEARQRAADLMRRFARRAFRRPVSDEVLAPYLDLVDRALGGGAGLAEALQGGYRALLVSPRFLYLQETPGRLDDHALAARLSYFLWNEPPDDLLGELADRGRLRHSHVLDSQVERMLNDDRGRRFVSDLAAEWLDLKLIDFTEPDRRLYPQFDPIVQHSMLDETHAFLQYLLENDLGVGRLIDSDFTFLNSRLARFYGVASPVKGDALRKVELVADDQRGGVLTQGAVLKVTANGTTTSPVIRGVWVSERLLGQPIPPPPRGVPAVEPDIRGATSIREILAKHRSSDTCNACHVKIDPPGFALENYDPSGRWRTHYGPARKKPGAAVVDASYETPAGDRFENIAEFRALILRDQEQLARNFAEKLLAYGTGAVVGFADRAVVDQVVQATRPQDYGLRSLLKAVVFSETFRSK